MSTPILTAPKTTFLDTKTNPIAGIWSMFDTQENLERAAEIGFAEFLDHLEDMPRAKDFNFFKAMCIAVTSTSNDAHVLFYRKIAGMFEWHPDLLTCMYARAGDVEMLAPRIENDNVDRPCCFDHCLGERKSTVCVRDLIDLMKVPTSFVYEPTADYAFLAQKPIADDFDPEWEDDSDNEFIYEHWDFLGDSKVYEEFFLDEGCSLIMLAFRSGDMDTIVTILGGDPALDYAVNTDDNLRFGINFAAKSRNKNLMRFLLIYHNPPFLFDDEELDEWRILLGSEGHIGPLADYPPNEHHSSGEIADLDFFKTRHEAYLSYLEHESSQWRLGRLKTKEDIVKFTIETIMAFGNVTCFPYAFELFEKHGLLYERFREFPPRDVDDCISSEKYERQYMIGSEKITYDIIMGGFKS